MKKYLSLIVALLSASVALMAEPITQQQALLQARSFFASHGISISQKAKALRAPGMTAQADTTHAPYYVINADKGGYVVVSGDDSTEPVLGYSLSGKLDADNMPDNLRWWLQEYARQIEYIQKNGLIPAKAAQNATDRDRIEPMLTTRWNQGEPYYNNCPTTNNQRTYTGCVATAMAQVLYSQYQQHPESMATTIQQAIPSYTTRSLSLSVPAVSAGSTIDWANMLNDYSGTTSTTQQDAVANLMLYCGTAVEMDYTTTGSGAYSASVPVALTKYFGMDASAQAVSRSSAYTNKEWNDLIYNELQNRRAVYYSGASSANSGHAFVIDGYEGNNYFHVNWGWGGVDNGAYLLSLLAPPSGGTGAGIISDGYNYSQQIVINIEPDHGGDAALSLYVYNFTVSADTVEFLLYNLGDDAVTFDSGLGIIADDGTITPVDSDLNITCRSYYGQGFYYLLSSLPNGTYRIAPIGKYTSGGHWQNLLPGHTVTISVRNGLVTVVDTPAALLRLDGTMALGYRPVTNMPCRLTANIANDGDDDFNGPLFIFASKTTTKGTAVETPTFGAIAGGSNTLNATWTPTTAGTYTLWLCTGSDGSGVLGSLGDVEVVEGRTIKNDFNITVSNLTVENADESTQTIDNDLRLTTHIVGNSITGTFIATFGDSISGMGQTTDLLRINDDGTTERIYGVYNWGYYNLPTISGGQSYQLMFSFSNLSDGKYALLISFGNVSNYMIDNPRYYNDTYAFTIGDETATGIKTINVGTADTAVAIYNLQGQLVGTMLPIEVGKLPRGIYIVNGKKITVK